jgi:hypothetical protein
MRPRHGDTSGFVDRQAGVEGFALLQGFCNSALDLAPERKIDQIGYGMGFRYLVPINS